MTTEQQDEAVGTDRLVCPGCLHEQAAGPHFCAACGAPLTSFSTVGPFERIFAQGHALRRAAGGPTRRIVVIGMWLLVLPHLLFLLMGPSEGYIFMLSIGLLYGILLWRVTANYVRRSRQAGIKAPSCDAKPGDGRAEGVEHHGS